MANLLAKIKNAPNDLMRKKAITDVLGLLRILKYDQVPTQVIDELKKKGLEKEPEETMSQWTDRIIAAFLKEFEESKPK